MPDIKRNFTGGKMNKDLDERIVPNGEYRDALNIEVSTSEDSETGTIQNIRGNFDGCIDTAGVNMWTAAQSVLTGQTFPVPVNQNFNLPPAGSKTIGSIADEKHDTLYWLVAGPKMDASDVCGLVSNITFPPAPNPGVLASPIHASDMILRKTPTHCEPVFVDNHSLIVSNQDPNGTISNSADDNTIVFSNADWLDQIQPGMVVSAITCNDGTTPCTTSSSATVTSIGSLNTITMPFDLEVNINTTQQPNLGHAFLETATPDCAAPCSGCQPPLNQPQPLTGWIYLPSVYFSGGSSPQIGDRVWTGGYPGSPNGLLSDGTGTNPNVAVITQVDPNVQVCDDTGVCTNMGRIRVSEPIALNPNSANPTSLTLNRDCNSYHVDHTSCNNCCDCAYWGQTPQTAWASDPNGNIMSNSISIGWETTTVTTNPTNTIQIPPNNPWLNELNNTFWDYTQTPVVAIPGFFNAVTIDPSPNFPVLIQTGPLTGSTDACLVPAQNPPYGPVQPGNITNNFFDVVQCGTTNPVIPIMNGLDTTSSITIQTNPLTVLGGAGLQGFAASTVFLDQNLDLSAQQYCFFYFQGKKVLGYDQNKPITGLNIFDDMLTWVDGTDPNGTEPKKINISRSVQGTLATGTVHTRLINESLDYNYNNITGPVFGTNQIRIKEEHITVIRKSPKNALTLKTLVGREQDVNYGGIVRTTLNPVLPLNTNNDSSIVTSSKGMVQNFSTLVVGDTVTVLINESEIPVQLPGVGLQREDFYLTDWASDKIVVLKEFIRSNPADPTDQGVQPSVPFNYRIKARITDWKWNNFRSDRANWGLQPPTVMNSVITSPYSVGPALGTGLPPGVGLTNRTYHDGTFTASKNTALVQIQIIDVDGTPPNIADDPNATYLDYLITLADEEEKVYKFKLPRFSYRYKYEDGEYSSIAPYTRIAFLPSNFDYHPTEGYNLGMVNNAGKIVLEDFITQDIPEDVVAIDILYKEELSPSIYVVDTLEPVDPTKKIFPPGSGKSIISNNWNLNSFEITKDTIKSILPENQSLRHWDNVPLKAQSQEVTANRVVYGNYIQNFDLTAGLQTNLSGKPLKYSPNFSLALNNISTNNIAVGSPIKSIKSLREYQLGVVFIDKYGRETPVISNSSGTIEVKKIDALNPNEFKVGFKDTNPPPGLTFFKFFVKETSGEYYNLAMGRYYDAEDDNVWLTFPSSDRNKVDIDTYLILKKGPDSNTLVKEEARYKILAISNEAPDWVKTKQILIDEVQNRQGTTTNYAFLANTLVDGEVPAEGNSKIKLNLVRFNTSTSANLDKIATRSSGEGALYIQFGRAGIDGKSKRYRITEITKNNLDVGQSAPGVVTPPPTHYFLNIDGKFGNDVSFLQAGGGMADDVTILIYHYRPENDPQFDGRFWAKIKSDIIFREYIQKSFDKATVDYSTVFQQKIYLIGSNIIADHSHESSGMINGTIGANLQGPGGAGNVGLDTHFENLVNSPSGLNNYISDAGTGSPSSTSVQPWDGSTQAERNNIFMYNIYYGYDHEYMYNTNPNITPGDEGLFRATDRLNPRTVFGSSYTGPTDIKHEHYWTIDQSSAIGRVTGGDNLFMGVFDSDGDYKNLDGSVQGIGRGPGPASPYLSTSWSTQFGIQTTSSQSTLDITFGGILPSGNWVRSPHTDNLWYEDQPDFYDLKVNTSHQDGQTQQMINRIYPSSQWAWKQDLLLKDIYTISTGVGAFNLLRYSDRGYYIQGTPSSGGNANRTMYQHPANFAKNYKFDTTEPINFNPTIGGGGTAGHTYVVAGSARVDLTSVAPTIANHTAVGTYPHNLTNLAVYTTGIEDITAVTGKKTLTDDGTWGLVLGNGTALDTQMVATPVTTGQKQDCFVVKKITPDTPSPGVFEIQLAGYRRVLDITDDLPVGVTNLITGTLTFYQLVMNGLSPRSADYLGTVYDCPGCVKAVGYDMEFVEPIVPVEVLPENPAIWETEPKDTTDLEIYHEISDYNSLVLGPDTIKTTLPIGSIVEESNNSNLVQPGTVITNNTSSPLGNVITLNQPVCGIPPVGATIVSAYCGSIGSPANQVFDPNNNKLKITRPNGSQIVVEVSGLVAPQNLALSINTNLYNNTEYILDYHNCFTFLNGVESNRIRDGYNLSFIGNGVKASSTLDSKYEQEHRKYGLIYSGIYNSKSGINNLNQFIMAEKITKDVNPNYGSIQHLHARDTDLVTLCEDKVLRILANKDAVFNADGNTNLTATENVLGQTIPFVGEYGISKDATSFASESYRAYFTDTTRGAVMRLSKDGLTPISDHGMRDWFRDNLKLSKETIGSYDDRKNEYNITLVAKPGELINNNAGFATVTFKENSKGWVSFKSFFPEEGRSCANVYYTWLSGRLWEHHSDRSPRTNFYGLQYQSRFTMVFNESPGSVKNFKTVNYEGSNSRIREFKTSTVTDWLGNTAVYNDDRYDNVRDVDGWWVQKIRTDLQDGWVPEFINKEGKWFNYIKGPDYLDSARPQFDEFAAQGQGGFESFNPNVQIIGCTDPNALNFDPLAITACQDVNGVSNGTAFANGISFNAVTDCCDPCVFGCTNPSANNYNPFASCDDGSCFISGCTNPASSNYNPAATVDDGSCITPLCGCVDNLMVLGENASGGLGGGPAGVMVNYYINYDSTATCDCACECDQAVSGWPDTSCCVPAMYGCMNPTAWNYSSIYNIQSNEPCTSFIDSNGLLQWNGQHCNCLSTIYGCTDSTALNYDPTATVMCDGSIMGCVGNCGGPGNNDCCQYPGPPPPPPPPPGIPPSFDCVNNQCIDPGTGLGQYADINTCIAQCPVNPPPPPIPPSWDCVITQQAPNGVCQDPGNGLGVYSTLATCQATPCPSIPSTLPSFNCSTGVCVDPGDGSGIFQDLASCQTALAAGTVSSCAGMIDTGVVAPSGQTPLSDINIQLLNWLIANAPGQPFSNYYGESGNLGQTNIPTLCMGPNNGAYTSLTAIQVNDSSNNASIFTATSWNALTNWGTNNGCPALATATSHSTADSILASCNSNWNLQTSSLSCQCTGCGPIIGPGPTPSFDCVNGTCIDPGTGLGTYSTLADCQNNCLPTPTRSFNCVGGNCVDPGDGSGVYATLAACQANCVPPPSFDCVNGACVDPGTGLGTYSQLIICQAVCTPPPTYSCNTASYSCFDPGNGSGQYQSLATCQASCQPPANEFDCDYLTQSNSPFSVSNPGQIVTNGAVMAIGTVTQGCVPTPGGPFTTMASCQMAVQNDCDAIAQTQLIQGLVDDWDIYANHDPSQVMGINNPNPNPTNSLLHWMQANPNSLIRDKHIESTVDVPAGPCQNVVARGPNGERMKRILGISVGFGRCDGAGPGIFDGRHNAGNNPTNNCHTFGCGVTTAGYPANGVTQGFGEYAETWNEVITFIQSKGINVSLSSTVEQVIQACINRCGTANPTGGGITGDPGQTGNLPDTWYMSKLDYNWHGEAPFSSPSIHMAIGCPSSCVTYCNSPSQPPINPLNHWTCSQAGCGTSPIAWSPGGGYATLALCQAACPFGPPPPPPTPTWDCDPATGACSQVAGGPYSTLADCQTNCPPPPPDRMWICDQPTRTCQQVTGMGTFQSQAACIASGCCENC